MSRSAILGGIVGPFLVLAAATAEPVLQIRGQVVRPDGSPAEKAALASGRTNASFANCETDADGRFILSGSFYEDAHVIARSADETMQREVWISSLEARSFTEKPLRIELRPARSLTVHVTRDGKPVPNVHLATDSAVKESIFTDNAGKAQLLIPNYQVALWIHAWHPEFGIASSGDVQAKLNESAPVIELTLHEPQPRRFRVVDQRHQAVAGLKLWPGFGSKDGHWFASRGFPNLHGTTDAEGEIAFAWAPRAVQYVDGELADATWLLEKMEHPTDERDTATLHVRKKRAFHGRLVVPEGCNPSDLLIAGRSFGPGNRGDIVATRAARDGSFSLQLAPEHCYAFSVCDWEWSSEPIAAVFAREGADELMAPLELKVHCAAPLEIRATVGPEQMPLRDASVLISRNVESKWTDAARQSRNGLHGISYWVKTDQDGYVRSGLGKGTYQLSIYHEKWKGEQTLDVKSDEPLVVPFHKPYEGRRKITGQLRQTTNRTGTFEGVKVVAVQTGSSESRSVDVKADAKGRFLLDTDCPTVRFFALDEGSSLYGSAVASETQSAVEIELKPTATYEGRLIDGRDSPIASAHLTLSLAVAPTTFIRQAATDGEGRFQFDQVMVDEEVRLAINRNGQSELLDRNFFEPCEQRKVARVRWQNSPSGGTPPVASKPLKERLQNACRNARLASMHVLLVISDERTEVQKFVQEQVLDFERNPPVWDFFPLSVTREAVRANAADLSLVEREGWPLPADGHVVLVAFDGASQKIGALDIAAEDEDAGSQVRGFLERRRPTLFDGQETWRAALAQAKDSDRRLLVQFGGARCGPCFLFSRWIDDHHGEIERDYVLLKLHSDRHPGAEKIEEKLRGKSGSIPWTAIVDADGNILATSDGPLGNIGFPSEVESIRHFRRMLEKTAKRLTRDEIAALMATLEQ